MFSSRLQKLATVLLIMFLATAVIAAVKSSWIIFTFMLLFSICAGAFVWLEHSIGDDRSARPRHYNNRMN